jgi:hypothetical protein
MAMTGRCLCGGVRFEVEGPFGRTAFCHCTSCQRASGSAFSVNAPVPVSRLRWTVGQELIREYPSSPGKHRAFCSRCGSPLYARHASEPGSLNVRLGLVEGDPGVRPNAHFNVSDRASWYTIEDELPQHEGDTEG